MNIKKSLTIAMLFCFVALGLFNGCKEHQRISFPDCEAISATSSANLQYGLINTLEKEIWWNAVTDDSVGDADVNLKLFQSARLSAKWLGWRKLPVQTPQYAKITFMRSPGCKEDGLFTRQKTFEQIFLHTFNILKDSKSVVKGQLKKLQLEAYLKLEFAVGTPVNILTSPENVNYVQILSPTRVFTEVPEGWEIKQYRLEQPLELKLVRLLEYLENTQSHTFVGPLPKSLDLLAYGTNAN